MHQLESHSPSTPKALEFRIITFKFLVWYYRCTLVTIACTVAINMTKQSAIESLGKRYNVMDFRHKYMPITLAVELPKLTAVEADLIEY